MEAPFARTTCACAACVQCCREQPGHLLPGQLEDIAAYLQRPVAEVQPLFWASPGAVVMDTHTQRQFRIGTITPRFDRRRKACVFLSDAGACTIHPVAPFGCSHFDTHMRGDEGDRRSTWGLLQILASAAYTHLRASLPFADSYQPKLRR